MGNGENRRIKWLLALCAKLPAGDAQRVEMEAVLLARLADIAHTEATRRGPAYDLAS